VILIFLTSKKGKITMVNQIDKLTKREAELMAKTISKTCRGYVFVVLMKDGLETLRGINLSL